MTAMENRSDTNETFSQITIHLQTLDEIHILCLSVTATLKHLYQIAKRKLLSHNHYHHCTHTLLYFNYRTHIFRGTDIDNEHPTPNFFVYALPKDRIENTYV